MKTRIQDIFETPTSKNQRINKIVGTDAAQSSKILRESQKLQKETVEHLQKPMDRTFLTPVADMLKKLNII